MSKRPSSFTSPTSTPIPACSMPLPDNPVPDTGPLRPVLERAVSAIVVENAGIETEAPRTTLHLQPLPFAKPSRDEPIEKLAVELQVVANVEVEVSIFVDVAERGARPPPFVLHPGGPGRERSVAVVPVQNVGAVVRHVDVRIPVVVEGGDR